MQITSRRTRITASALVATAAAATTLLAAPAPATTPLATPAPAAPGDAAQKCRLMTPKVAKENAVGRKLVNRLRNKPDFTVITKTVTPQISRSKGFDGFGTMIVRGEPGTIAVIGALRFHGTQCGSVVIKSAVTSLHRNAYVVRFEAPGEQGDPGKITLTLVSL